MEVLERRHDALRGLAVAVGIRRVGHLRVGDRVGQQPVGDGDDAVRVGADELERAGIDALDALGHLARDEHGLAQRGSLLLNAARVGDDEVQRASRRANSP